jgi:hypothetical protein
MCSIKVDMCFTTMMMKKLHFRVKLSKNLSMAHSLETSEGKAKLSLVVTGIIQVSSVPVTRG